MCGGNERERESVENIFFSFFFLPPSIFFFSEREIKKKVCVGVVIGKNERSVDNFSFLYVLTECVFILTPCNINAILALIVMNNIRKESIMIAANFGDQSQPNKAQNQSSSVTNQSSTKSIPIKN